MVIAASVITSSEDGRDPARHLFHRTGAVDLADDTLLLVMSEHRERVAQVLGVAFTNLDLAIVVALDETIAPARHAEARRGGGL